MRDVKGFFLSVGTRLREARSNAYLSQVEMAALGGVGRSTQIRFEQDENLPGGAYWLGLHAAGIDVCYILTGLLGTMTADESELLARYRKADEVGRAMMFGVGTTKASKSDAA